jgi:hypothetical protein
MAVEAAENTPAPRGGARVALSRCLAGCAPSFFKGGSPCSRCKHRNGSTRQCRNTPARVVYRDRWTDPQCGAPASHVDHMTPALFGGAERDPRAPCARRKVAKGASGPRAGASSAYTTKRTMITMTTRIRARMAMVRVFTMPSKG